MALSVANDVTDRPVQDRAVSRWSVNTSLVRIVRNKLIDPALMA